MFIGCPYQHNSLIFIICFYFVKVEFLAKIWRTYLRRSLARKDASLKIFEEHCKMEVMNPVDYSLQEKINGLSKQYFSYSTSIKDRNLFLHEQANKCLHIETDQTGKLAPTGRNKTHSLIVWGCGEFGQHGLTQSGDVTFEMALSEFKSGALMLPNGQVPVSTVCGSSHTLVLTGMYRLIHC